MSNFLLEKSFRLFQDSKHIKKTKKSSLEKLRRKKYKFSEKSKEEIEQNILKNIKSIEKVNSQISVDVPKEILPFSKGNATHEDENSQLKEEESTIFTEKDFEEFEKEYFDS